MMERIRPILLLYSFFLSLSLFQIERKKTAHNLIINEYARIHRNKNNTHTHITKAAEVLSYCDRRRVLQRIATTTTTTLGYSEITHEKKGHQPIDRLGENEWKYINKQKKINLVKVVWERERERVRRLEKEIFRRPCLSSILCIWIWNVSIFLCVRLEFQPYLRKIPTTKKTTQI